MWSREKQSGLEGELYGLENVASISGTKAAVLVFVITANGKGERVQGAQVSTLAGTHSRSGMLPLARLGVHGFTKLQGRLGNAVISCWPCALLKSRSSMIKEDENRCQCSTGTSAKYLCRILSFFQLDAYVASIQIKVHLSRRA